jgi:hypothetical protein
MRLTVALTLFACCGCGPKLPPIVPVEGVVTINGKPVANALVVFMPVLERFGMETISTATTDEHGHYTLICQTAQTPGAVTGSHIVTVSETAVPENFRTGHDYKGLEAYYAKFGNRPIPTEYQNRSKTPLKIEVSNQTPVINLDLKR